MEGKSIAKNGIGNIFLDLNEKGIFVLEIMQKLS